MRVTEAVESRRSVRAFLDKPVDSGMLRQILAQAARAPSGGNLQPWHIHVVGGESMTHFLARMRERLSESPRDDGFPYDVYPKALTAPYRDRRFKIGEDMYALLGIPREDKLARLAWFARNYQFFGAPVALFCFVDRRMGLPQWSDLGMYLQTVMLLARAHGLDSCAQEAWAGYHHTVREILGGVPEELMLFCGMAIGYADPDAPVNRLKTERAGLAEFVRFHGI